ncbi:DNA topoisomerase IV subunit A [Gammaproteobacteria bacterium]|nr:DNA topoisomerase IV subunit A [Gammaproteobacteria bacterium]
MTKNRDLFSSNIEKVSIGDFSEDAYLNYSMYVILDRALPSLLDGLKPVQRRIIYAMSELGLKYSTKYKKSARTVGDVLGKFHPHGDTACYEAMVIMAQSFAYNMPLIDGQGNWGTQDDPKSFAAMRYTESKLTKYSELLLHDLKNGTSDWIPNFDGTLDEPKFLPSQVPNILINGSSGIAVGMSTDIPPHNLGEIILAVQHVINNPKCTIKELMEFIPAPDYPTGAHLLHDESDIDAIYNEGTGNIKLRAEYNHHGKSIEIISLPYQASTTKIIEQIQSQIIEKKIGFINTIEDQSDEKNPVKIIMKIKGNSHSPTEVMNHLYFTTDLERNYRVNLNMISANGKPRVMNLKEILSEWVSFRVDTYRRKLNYENNQILERLHILEGFLIVYKHLDKIIEILRNEDNPKPKIIKIGKFSEKQYESIINMRLRNIAKLEEDKIKDEYENLKKRNKEINSILKSKSKLNKIIINDLDVLSEEYAYDRRTNILFDTNSSKQILQEIKVSSEPMSLVLSSNGWVKTNKGITESLDNLIFKSGDSYLSHIDIDNDKQVSFLDQKGFIYSMMVNDIPTGRGYGEPLKKYFNIDDGIHATGMVDTSNNLHSMFISESGYGFLCKNEELMSSNRNGKSIVKNKTSNIIRPLEVDIHNYDYYLLVTNNQYLILARLDDLPILTKGKGVKLINIPKSEDNEKIIFSGVIRSDQRLEILAENKRTKYIEFKELQPYIMNRTRRGKKIEQKFIHKKIKLNYNIGKL